MFQDGGKVNKLADDVTSYQKWVVNSGVLPSILTKVDTEYQAYSVFDIRENAIKKIPNFA